VRGIFGALMEATLDAKATPLQFRLLGKFEVSRGDAAIPLPQSKKTRALLAYLAGCDRAQRRDYLCEMFWELPDDPRAALRWSLSRTRQIVGDALNADRDAVSLNLDGIDVDQRNIRRMAHANLDGFSVDELEQAVRHFRGRFLDDLSLPRCPMFEAWRTANMNEAELIELRLRRRLVDVLGDEPQRALVHAHALLARTPDDKSLASEVEALAQRSRQDASARATNPSAEPAQSDGASAAADLWQDIRYCSSRDGTQIAYAISGEGAPILKAANWMSHLQFEWESPIWRHWIQGLSEAGRLYRYDERGNGMSDWDVADVGFDAMFADLEAVVAATGLEQFALLGISRGCALAIAYAARHPERVSRLILYGGYAKGWRARGDASEIAVREAMVSIIREGWGKENPAFRQMFTSLFVPGATQKQMDWFNELQRQTVSPDNAARLQLASAIVDVSDQLSSVKAPTLILHSRGDSVVPMTCGRDLATQIPNARFVLLDSKNHILLEDEPAFGQFLVELRRFLSS
jgi:pimeloyl-ACP methyl ester carboxylesterase